MHDCGKDKVGASNEPAGAERLKRTSANPRDERLAALRDLIPEAFAEGRVDFEKLRIALGDDIAIGRERYGLTWPGKADAMRAVQTPSTGTLVPDRAESVDFDSTEHVFIEGDNLEVLKILQKSYHGKVKLIYIDPPYNTGKEFIYPDNYREGLDDYLKFSGQVGEGGARIAANTETGGRYHSKWLSMMWPRLFVARNLLREDGLLFASIDDHELANLRRVMDEVFGEENFLGTIAWQNLDTIKNDAQLFSDNHEYLLCYARNSAACNVGGLPRTAEQNAVYKNRDNDRRGPYLLTPLHAKSGSEGAKYQFTFKNGQTWEAPNGRYPRYSRERLAKMEADGRIFLSPDGRSVPQVKTYLSEVGNEVRPTTFWSCQDAGSTRQSNAELKRLVGEGVFDNPKPTKLVRRILTIGASAEDIVLDFFAGSGTTAHAAWLECLAGRRTNWVIVQLPQPIDHEHPAFRAGHRTISGVCRARLAAAANDIRASAPLMAPPDLGFRAFRLAPSNFRTWNADQAPTDPAALSAQIESFTDHLLPGRSDEDILFEILLRRGIPLSARVTKRELAGATWHTLHDGAIWISPARSTPRSAFDAILALTGDDRPQEVIVLDQAFGDDQTKANVVQQFLDTAISAAGDGKSPQKIEIRIL